MQLGGRALELARALLDGFKRHDLLTYASAISFQILTAIIPLLCSYSRWLGCFISTASGETTSSQRSRRTSPPPRSR